MSVWQKLNEKIERDIDNCISIDALHSLSALNDAEKNEIKNINLAFKEQLITLGLKTSYHSTAVNKIGYTFARQCIQKDCQAFANLRINFKKGTAKISYNVKCIQHTF